MDLFDCLTYFFVYLKYSTLHWPDKIRELTFILIVYSYRKIKVLNNEHSTIKVGRKPWIGCKIHNCIEAWLKDPSLFPSVFIVITKFSSSLLRRRYSAWPDHEKAEALKTKVIHLHPWCLCCKEFQWSPTSLDFSALQNKFENVKIL